MHVFFSFNATILVNKDVYKTEAFRLRQAASKSVNIHSVKFKVQNTL